MATTIRYSEAFKLEVIDSLAHCKYKTIADAKRAFGVTGCGTVERVLSASPYEINIRWCYAVVVNR